MEQKLNNIVIVPTDFSDICQNAINHGAELAEYLGYKLVLLHVFNKESKVHIEKENLSTDDIKKELGKLADQANKDFGVKVGYETRDGSIFTEIHETASNLGANIMVMGTHGKKGLQHVFGSHALKIVTKSPVPTIVVQKRGFGQGYKKIVFPINDFTEARQQVQWAVHIGNTFKSDIHIYQQPHKDAGLASKIDIVTQQIEEAFNENNIIFKITKAEKTRNFANQMISFAASIHADMIMIMTDGDIFSPDFRAGPWDEKMMFNEPQIPVMCINPIMTGKVFYGFPGTGL